ncbi:MAG TPA: O-antigen ligase family protein [Myxococcales bacterium]|jgi:hypothetical protein
MRAHPIGRGNAKTAAVAFALAAVTAAAAVVGNGKILVALAPPLAALLLVAVWQMPLRISALGLLFLSLATEAQGEALKSPLYALGVALHQNLNLTIPIQALRITGIDVILAYLLLIAIVRRVRGDGRDASGVPVPRALGYAAAASLLTLFALVVYGIATHGDVNQVYWQIHQFALIPVLFFLFRLSSSSLDDQLLLGRVYVAASLVRAAMAIYVRTFVQKDFKLLATATSHADSVLFVTAVAAVLAMFLEKPTRKSLVRLLWTCPIFFWAMYANGRRLAWVELAFVLVAFYLFSPWTRLKRAVARTGVVMLPFFVVYLVVGWQSQSKLFAPAKMVRSVVESKSDRSTEERDVENFNLLETYRSSPLFGLGFGHGYIEAVKGDDISNFFAQYRYVPHNSLLGTIAFAGALGFFGIWLPVALGVFFAVRAYRRARRGVDRAAALTVIASVIVYFIQCYGDMGLVSWTGAFTIGPALVVAGKLAVGVSAWPMPRRRRPRPPGLRGGVVTKVAA